MLFFVYLLLHSPLCLAQIVAQVVISASDIAWPFDDPTTPGRTEPWANVCPEAVGKFETPNLWVTPTGQNDQFGMEGGILDLFVVVPTRVNGASATLRLVRQDTGVHKAVNVSSTQQGNDAHCVLAHLYTAQVDDPPAPDSSRLGGLAYWHFSVTVFGAGDFAISTIVLQLNPDVQFIAPTIGSAPITRTYIALSTSSTTTATATSGRTASSADKPGVPVSTQHQAHRRLLPIVLGGVLGTFALVVGLLVALYVRRVRRNPREAKIELMVPNYEPETLASPPDVGVSTPLLSATLQPQLSPTSATTGADGAAPDVGFFLYASPTKKKRGDTSSVVDTAVDEKAQLQRGSSTAPPQSGSSGSQMSAVAESSDAAGNGIGSGSEMGGKRVMDEDAGIVVGELQPPASPPVGDSNGEDPPPMYTPRE